MISVTQEGCLVRGVILFIERILLWRSQSLDAINARRVSEQRFSTFSNRPGSKAGAAAAGATPSANFSALLLCTRSRLVSREYTSWTRLERERGKGSKRRGMKGHQRESDQGGDVVSPGIGCPVIESLISLRSLGRRTL